MFAVSSAWLVTDFATLPLEPDLRSKLVIIVLLRYFALLVEFAQSLSLKLSNHHVLVIRRWIKKCSERCSKVGLIFYIPALNFSTPS